METGGLTYNSEKSRAGIFSAEVVGFSVLVKDERDIS